MAKVVIPDKICPHCGGNTWYDRTINGKSSYECYVKHYINMKNWRLNNKDKARTSNRNWEKRNPEKLKQYSLKSHNLQAATLNDTYIRQLIKSTTNRDAKRHGDNTRITSLDISPEQIIRRREILKVQQFIKKQKNYEKSN